MQKSEHVPLKDFLFIFQAHALAVQTGCEILVKLDDSTDHTSSHYYATTLLQHAFKHDGIREKPGDKLVCGETGHPVTLTVDSAVQSGPSESEENGVVALDKIPNNVTNCSPKVPDGSKSTENSIIPVHLTVTSGEQESPPLFPQPPPRSESTSSSNGQSDVVLDFSLKNSQGETKAKIKDSPSPSSTSSLPAVEVSENSNNMSGVENEQSPIVALLQRPGLLPTDSER